MQNGTAIAEDSLAISYKTKHSYSLIHRSTSYLPKFHAKPACEDLDSLFIIAKTWKQPTWSSVDEWTNKLQYI